MLVRKNTAARTAVDRLRKFADPLAPNRLPADPLPNAAPKSAPFPCCRSTSPITHTAARTCKINTIISMFELSIPCSTIRRPADRVEFLSVERGAADQTAVDIRHREQPGRVAALHAAAVQNRRLHRTALCGHAASHERMHRLRLLGRCRLAGTDRPYRLVGQYDACHALRAQP